jgi:hypothetical protein
LKQLRKWNYNTHDYDAYEVPEDQHVSMCESNMDTVIDCAQCGCKMTFGSGYTSLEVHNSFGMGYTVCVDCHTSEIAREMAARKRERKEDADNGNG